MYRIASSGGEVGDAFLWPFVTAARCSEAAQSCFNYLYIPISRRISYQDTWSRCTLSSPSCVDKRDANYHPLPLTQEIYPLLPLLLTELSKLHRRAEDLAVKNILVELCLTVPARLASLLPHLPLLMRLMVHALRCRGELSGLALRTLEFWVDNLSPEYLYRVMSHDSKVPSPRACAYVRMK